MSRTCKDVDISGHNIITKKEKFWILDMFFNRSIEMLICFGGELCSKK